MQYSNLSGAIELPLKCAQVVDSDNIGLEFWYSGSPANDPRIEFRDRRLQCYDLVLDSLTVFEERSNNPKAADTTAVDPDIVRSHAYELAFSSEDEMFHSTMYDWLIDRGVADELLEVRSSLTCGIYVGQIISQMRPAFLEAHLKREPVTAAKYQLLWQFYIKDGQPLRAAEVLGALAESTQLVSRSNILTYFLIVLWITVLTLT
jgi:nuclear pore complex protein Nup155